MPFTEKLKESWDNYIVVGNHAQSDYLGLITQIAGEGDISEQEKREYLNEIYQLLFKEICENDNNPSTPISFGTSGWRGKLGKDVFARSVALVTQAIVDMYKAVDTEPELAGLLGVSSFAEAQKKGCVLGFDNRFGGEFLACQIAKVLSDSGIFVHYAGESTTGVLSASVLVLSAAFSINLTPSHNPLDYGGYKFNAADAGPAASEVTQRITQNVKDLTSASFEFAVQGTCTQEDIQQVKNLSVFSSLDKWKDLVEANGKIHGLHLGRCIERFLENKDFVVAIDCVHGASRLHIRELFDSVDSQRLILLRDNDDVTFGGVAPEPSSENMQAVVKVLQSRPEPLKLGAIIDPDGDRIRFTDGTTEISMNQFGAMAYHFLHEVKGKKGMVAKTVATSNLANGVAQKFGEEVFEPSVGFKNFKPVIGKALVCFEESDGISIIGHTPEKDAYIGLLLALDMVLTLKKNLGAYLAEIETDYGEYYPDRDGVEVTLKGSELQQKLDGLVQYKVGKSVLVGSREMAIAEVITVDGRKIIFEDGSWLMIRPSGTEPKVRFYVESRTQAGTVDLVNAARKMLQEIDLL